MPAHVHARRPRYQADPQVQQQVTERFLAAQLGGDVTALLELLAPDVTFVSNAGGKGRAALRPIHGSDKVARLLNSPTVIGDVPDFGIRYEWVNGGRSAVVLSGGTLYAVVVLDIDSATEKIRGVYAVRNPDKLTHLEGWDARSADRGDRC